MAREARAAFDAHTAALERAAEDPSGDPRERERIERERERAYGAAWAGYDAVQGACDRESDPAPAAEAVEGLRALALMRLREAEALEDRAASAQFLEALRGPGGGERPGDRGGTLALDTVPTGASVTCFAIAYVGGRHTEYPRAEGTMPKQGRTPLQASGLHGPYILVLEAPGVRSVRYPVLIERGEDEVAPEPIALLTDAEIGEGYVWIPPGESLLGGDRAAHQGRPLRRRRLPGFCLGTYEVREREYAAFLAARLAAGETADAIRARCPRREPGGPHAWRVEGGALVGPEPARAEWPVTGVSIGDAEAYCRWRSTEEGRQVRLPTEEEWERAARGADGRHFPWGNGFDWSRLVGARSPCQAEGQRPHPVGTAADDVSPFGVHDMAGSAEEWCADVRPDGSRAAKGGSWLTDAPQFVRAASRYAVHPDAVYAGLGFRVAAEPKLHQPR